MLVCHNKNTMICCSIWWYKLGYAMVCGGKITMTYHDIFHHIPQHVPPYSTKNYHSSHHIPPHIPPHPTTKHSNHHTQYNRIKTEQLHTTTPGFLNTFCAKYYFTIFFKFA